MPKKAPENFKGVRIAQSWNRGLFLLLNETCLRAEEAVVSD